jgi:molecular chaperone DnaK (HSP70)
MLFLLAAFSSSHGLVGIDLGTEFLKVAISQPDGHARMHRFPQSAGAHSNGISWPAAIAYKTNGTIKRITREDANFTESVTGGQALSRLRSDPSTGYRYPARALNRNTTDFLTTTLADPLESLAILLIETLTQLPQVSSGIAIAVPFFWSREIRQSIANAVHLSRIRLLSIIDNSTAVAALYGEMKYSRYQKLSVPR